MSLFTINRYEGNEQISSSVDKESLKELADKKLQKILKKAEKRKRARERQKIKKQFPLPKLKKKKVKLTEISDEIQVFNEETKEVNDQLEDEEGADDDKDAKGGENTFPFQILGTNTFSKTKKVKRFLPHWLSHPVKVSSNLNELSCKIEDLSIVDVEFQNVLRQHYNFTHYFPIQAAVIPYCIQENRKPPYFWPRDICIAASTGSGKTIAFVIPIVQILKNRVVRKIRALVVLPVKELAAQVYEVFQQFSKVTDLKVVLLGGSISFEEEQQHLIKDIGNGKFIFESDIVITTPGRLVDHIHQTVGFTLKYLMFLVIDEADRIMDREQDNWIYHLEQHLHQEDRMFRTGRINLKMFKNSNPPPQKILASATLTHDPEKLYRIGLFKPKLFVSIESKDSNDVEECEEDDTYYKYVVPKELTQQYLVCSVEKKPLILYYLITTYKMKKILCFTGSGLETHRLALFLKILSKNKISVLELSRQLTKAKREEVLNKFSNGEADVLVSTDALARGLDIPDVQYVISYNAPKYVQTHVHRVGRTARAGKTGTAITLLNHQKQKRYFLKIISNTCSDMEEIKINDTDLENLLPLYEKSLGKMKSTVEMEVQRKKLKIKQTKNPKLKINRRKTKKSSKLK